MGALGGWVGGGWSAVHRLGWVGVFLKKEGVFKSTVGSAVPTRTQGLTNGNRGGFPMPDKLPSRASILLVAPMAGKNQGGEGCVLT